MRVRNQGDHCYVTAIEVNDQGRASDPKYQKFIDAMHVIAEGRHPDRFQNAIIDGRPYAISFVQM